MKKHLNKAYKLPKKYEKVIGYYDLLLLKEDREYIVNFLKRLYNDIMELETPVDHKLRMRKIFKRIINVFNNFDELFCIDLEFKLKKYVIISEIAEHNNLFDELKANEDFMKLTALIMINYEEFQRNEELTRFEIVHHSDFNIIIKDIMNL